MIDLFELKIKLRKLFSFRFAKRLKEIGSMERLSNDNLLREKMQGFLAYKQRGNKWRDLNTVVRIITQCRTTEQLERAWKCYFKLIERHKYERYVTDSLQKDFEIKKNNLTDKNN